MKVGIKKRATLLVVALVAGTALLAGCASAPAAEPTADPTAGPVVPKTLKIGITSLTAPPTILPLLAEKLGIAETHGLTLELVQISSDVAAQALASGDIDILAAPSVESAIVQGADFKVVAGAALPYFSFWGRDGVVDSWADVAGHNIGIPAGRGSAADILIQTILKDEKVDLSSVVLTYNSSATNYQALTAGSVDAALTTPPYTYQLDSAGGFSEIDDLVGKVDTFISTQYTATSSLIQKDPDVIARFVDTLLDVKDVVDTDNIDPNVFTVYDAFLVENGTDPANLKIEDFFADLVARNAWQVYPKRGYFEISLGLLAQIPELAGAAGSAKFEDVVYVIPGREKEYE
ncbi:MAG: hypothetical protein JWP85_2335 [Rhodoglobus sp.]|nr:hypothetical protein [Rhodoglobus sp.]